MQNRLFNTFISKLTLKQFLFYLSISILILLICFSFIFEYRPYRLYLFDYIYIYISCIWNIELLKLYYNFNNEQDKKKTRIIAKFIQKLDSLIYKYTNNIFYKIFNYFYGILSSGENLDENIEKLYLYMYIYPRSFMTLFLFIDTFFYHQIYFVYLFSFLLLIIIIWKYMLCHMQKLLSKNVAILDNKYYVVITSKPSQDINCYFMDIEAIQSDYEYLYINEEGFKQPCITFEALLNLQCSAIQLKHTLYEYSVYIQPTYYEDTLDKTLAKKDIFKDYYNLTPITFKLYNVLSQYYILINYYHTKAIKNLKIGIVIFELFCCLYLLINNFMLCIWIYQNTLEITK